MAFDPHRNSEPRRAIRAGLIAVARGSRIIEMDDWVQAISARDRPLTPDDREKLEAMSVSDEVVRAVADEKSKQTTSGSGNQKRPGSRWAR